ncbi:MAG: sugar phosphate isomerase/epimerase, partial [Planctomycetaceae bacterium]|nr:sugar phosphate isomerase/epimerase [Planctomycetaceae bacterium]
QTTTLHWNLPDALAGFRSGGVPAIGLSLPRMMERGLEQSIDEVRQSGLLVSTVGWIGGFTGGRCGSWADVVQHAKLAIWSAAQVNAQAVVMVTGPRRSHIRSHVRRIVLDALRALAPFAERHGVKLSLQPMHPVCHRGWTFLHTVDETLNLLDAVQSPWIGLAYSPFHLCHEQDLLSRIPQLVNRIASVHVSDWAGQPTDDNDRPLPGDGTLPLTEHIEALESAGYRGLYEVDPWSRALWNRNPHGLIAECRRRFERLCAPVAMGPASPARPNPPVDPASLIDTREFSLV